MREECEALQGLALQDAYVHVSGPGTQPACTPIMAKHLTIWLLCMRR